MDALFDQIQDLREYADALAWKSTLVFSLSQIAETPLLAETFELSGILHQISNPNGFQVWMSNLPALRTMSFNAYSEVLRELLERKMPLPGYEEHVALAEHELRTWFQQLNDVARLIVLTEYEHHAQKSSKLVGR